MSKGGGIKWGIHLLQFIVVMVIFWILSSVISKLVSKALERQPTLSGLLRNFINTMSRRVILLVGLIVALGTIGVNVGAALALIGGGAFVLAFALQDTLGNFANGLMLLIYRPFDVGDAVEIGGVTGMPTRRVDMIFGIGSDDDAEKAREILGRIVRENEMVLEDPEPVVQLHELADSSVNFVCRPWVTTENDWAAHWDITKRVNQEFDAAGISIPYPQQDIHFHPVPQVPAPQRSAVFSRPRRTSP